MKLTSTQSKALTFIRTRIERSGVAPTLREICSHMGYSAVGSAQDIISALRKKGYIAEQDEQKARSLILTPLARGLANIAGDGDDQNTFLIPCLGSVPAGNPIEAVEEHTGTMRMSIAMFPRPYPRPDELFALQASGESMIKAGILDGDWLVVKLAREARDGTIVVARLEDDVTVKRLRKDSERGYYLQPENDRFSPIYADESPFELVGQVMALQRAMN